MVEAHQVQHRGVQVVNMHPVLDRVVAELVRCAVHRARFHPAARHEDREAVRVVVAPVGSFGKRRPAEFAAPDHQRLVEQAPALEIPDQAGDRLVDFPGADRMQPQDVAVMVPLLFRAGVRRLDDADAALAEPSREQALPAEIPGRFLVQAVEPAGRLAFA